MRRGPAGAVLLLSHPRALNSLEVRLPDAGRICSRNRESRFRGAKGIGADGVGVTSKEAWERLSGSFRDVEPGTVRSLNKSSTEGSAAAKRLVCPRRRINTPGTCLATHFQSRSPAAKAGPCFSLDDSVNADSPVTYFSATTLVSSTGHVVQAALARKLDVMSTHWPERVAAFDLFSGCSRPR